MRQRRRPQPRILLLGLLGGVVCVALITTVAIMMTSREPQKAITTAPLPSDYSLMANAATTRLTSRQALDDYIAAYKKDSHLQTTIHDIPSKIDWSRQQVIATEQSIYVAYSIQGVSLENVKGAPAIVVALQSPPQGCMSAQVNMMHLLFVAVPQGSQQYPVYRHVIPNDQTCSIGK